MNRDTDLHIVMFYVALITVKKMLEILTYGKHGKELKRLHQNVNKNYHNCGIMISFSFLYTIIYFLVHF